MTAVLLMVKDEEKIISKTLDSVRGFSSVLVYDTGSTDKTIEIASSYPNVTVEEGEFIDFSTSRNSMLDLADAKMEEDFFLLLDAGDEFKGDIILEDGCCGYMIPQVWQSSVINRYYNLRLIKAREGFRYKGRVHEYMARPEGRVIKRMEHVEIYQDRRWGNASSSIKRWDRDLIILKKEIADDPTNTRAMFYLAQTYECLRDINMAFSMYERRAEMEGGFYEEKFMAMLRCGNLAKTWKEKLSWYMRSFDSINRVEPLIAIARHYQEYRQFLNAWFFLMMACELKYPTECVLFVDREAYDYTRWHLLGIVSFYCNKDGKPACLKAITAKNKQIDKDNLKFYE